MSSTAGRWSWALVVCVVLCALAAHADMLVLKDGRVVEGQFVAGSETFIQFRAEGKIESYPLEQINSLHFQPKADSASNAASPLPPPTPAVVSAMAPGAVLLPVGFQMSIRFDDEVNSTSHKMGSAFQVLLERDLVVDGVVAAVKGSTVHGQVVDSRGGKKLGTQYLKLTLTALDVHNQKVPVLTGAFGVENSAGQSPRIVGAELAAGHDGAKPAPEQFVKDQDHVRIPRGTVLQVPLKEAVALYP